MLELDIPPLRILGEKMVNGIFCIRFRWPERPGLETPVHFVHHLLGVVEKGHHAGQVDILTGAKPEEHVSESEYHTILLIHPDGTADGFDVKFLQLVQLTGPEKYDAAHICLLAV